jgi:TolB-like protein
MTTTGGDLMVADGNGRVVSRMSRRLVPCIAMATLALGALVPLQRAGAQATRIVVGVLPFDAGRADSTLRPLGFGIADLIATDLAMIERLRVVERLRLGDVLREQQLTLGRAFDPSGAPRLGQLMRANRLVAGSLLASPNNQLLFEARILNADNGAVDTALRATANPTDILEAQKQITFGILARLGIGLTPRERSLIEQRPTRSLAALIAYGQGVDAELNGNFAAARRAFGRAATLDPSFRGAVTRLQQSNAIAIRTQGTLVQGVVNVVNPPLPRVPQQPPTGTIISPGQQLVGTVIVTISRP